MLASVSPVGSNPPSAFFFFPFFFAFFTVVTASPSSTFPLLPSCALLSPFFELLAFPLEDLPVVDLPVVALDVAAARDTVGLGAASGARLGAITGGGALTVTIPTAARAAARRCIAAWMSDVFVYTDIAFCDEGEAANGE